MTEVLTRKECWVCDGTGEGSPRDASRYPKCQFCDGGWIQEWIPIADFATRLPLVVTPDD